MEQQTTGPAILPLIYSCSGCSSVAQMANDVAVRLHREEKAEMSCIAGVGGGVRPLVRMAKSGREIIALDGCRLFCVLNSLKRHDVEPNLHVSLADFGIRKQMRSDYNDDEAQAVYDHIIDHLGASPDSADQECSATQKTSKS